MKALLLSLACITLFTAAGADAGTLTGTGTVRAHTLESASYPGSQARQYKVCVPRAYDGSKPVPMVFALHGCAMTNDDALDDWNWDSVADQNDLIVVFPSSRRLPSRAVGTAGVTGSMPTSTRAGARSRTCTAWPGRWRRTTACGHRREQHHPGRAGNIPQQG